LTGKTSTALGRVTPLTLLLRAAAALLLMAASAFAQGYPAKQVRIVPGGNVGAEIVYRAEPDGYTLLCSPPGPLSINHNLYRTLPYDGTKFVPIGVLALVPNVITARPDLPQASLKDFITYAKANPGKATYASQGNGPTSHLSASMLATLAGIELVHVPYKGEGPALVDLTGSRVDIFIGNISAGGSPAQTAAFIKDEEARWRGVIKSANVTLE